MFGHVFKGLDYISDALTAEIPTEWLKKLTEKHLTEEEKKLIEALGGLDKLLETLRKRLAEQKGRHQGGKKWIGTAGTSPFGAYGYNPEGVRIGQDGNRNFRAVKVWDKREFKDLAETSNSAPATSRSHCAACASSRAPARLTNSISTDHQGHRAEGLSRYPDAAGAAQHHQGAVVLRHRRLDGLAHQGDGGIVFRRQVRIQAHDASLLPQLPLRESVEGKPPALDRDDADLGRAAHLSARLQGHLRRRRFDVALRNRVARRLGRAFQRRSRQRLDAAGDSTYPSCVWLNPVAEREWDFTESIRMMRQLMGGRMFPLTLEGLDGAMKELGR